MSIFDEDNDDVKNSIRFFNQLPNEEKVRIVSNLNPFIFQQKQQYKRLFPLLSKIQKDISKHDAIRIGNKLMEYGLDETYARLFVSNVKKHAPTTEYQLSQMDKILDVDFCDKLPDIMKDLLVNNDAEDSLSERYGIEKEQIQCIADLAFDAMNNLGRGITTKEKLAKVYNQHISKTKTDVLINQILIHQENQRKISIFSDIQDAYINTSVIRQQNKEILRLLRELVEIKKRESREPRRV